jgi:hypothetical protein
MIVTVNGELHELPASVITARALVEHFDGDVLEVEHFVGGGYLRAKNLQISA